MGNTRLISYLASVVLLFLLLIPANHINGQIVSRKAKGKTYVFDTNRNLVYNHSIGDNSSAGCVTEGFYVTNYTIVADIFKNTLTADRIKEQNKDVVAVMFDCNVDGRVQSVKFLFTKSPFLTVEEVEKLERAFLNQPFDISTDLEEGTILSFTIPCFFSRIQKSE